MFISDFIAEYLSIIFFRTPCTYSKLLVPNWFYPIAENTYYSGGERHFSLERRTKCVRPHGEAPPSIKNNQLHFYLICLDRCFPGCPWPVSLKIPERSI